MRGAVNVTSVIATIVGWAGLAHAAPPKLVALAPAADARRAVAIGPAGEVYEPDGKGAWVRTQAGGTSEELVGARGAAAQVLGIAKDGTPFKWRPTGWSAIRFSPKARPIVGVGARLLAAVGKSTFALDRGEPTPLADAPAPVQQLAASGKRAVALTAKGLVELHGASWTLVKKAPHSIGTLVSDRWALAGAGALDLQSLKVIAWPAGLHVDDATTAGDLLFAVGTHGKQVELLTIKGGKLAREPIPVDHGGPVIGVAADREGHVVVALRDGVIAMRSGGTWTTTEVRVEIPAPRPGAPPAASQ